MRVIDGVDLLIDLHDRRLQGIVLPQVQPKHEAMMIGEPAVQGVVQLLRRRLDPPVGQCGQLRGIS